MNPALFASGKMERLIVASGGNLRNLFSMTSNACDSATLREASQVEAADVTGAIRRMRTDYERLLGESPNDMELCDGKPHPISYENKAARLVRIYNQDPVANVPDPVLYSLLRSRAVQEFNGERWFGVHPLVVDILVTQRKIARPDATEAIPGGTS